MSSILTLIAAPGKAQLTGDILGAVQTAVEAIGAAVDSPITLAPGEAVDLPFAGIMPAMAAAAARDALGSNAIDAVAQPTAHRRKALLVADMDSTIIDGETIDAMAALTGRAEEVSAITAAAMRGEIDFANSLRRRVALFADCDESLLAHVRDEDIRLNPGARTLLATMRAHGAYAVLVSGGFTLFTEYVADLAGFDAHQGNTVKIVGGRLTGLVAEPIINRDGKRQALHAIEAERGIANDAVLAVGDGANDLDMLAAAGLGVAYHAKPAVAEAASARIDHADLTALLYLQGYRADDFAAGP
ncbi:MAG: phosphoserine phosphatase SerB [Alphaproteobacteria bacterium]|jgi:phosphoserine phosphatase|nr:phosphoserine phosphatase SerB [Alphaproteobacteria bacterium]